MASLPEDLAALQWLETLDLTDNCFGTFPLPVLELGSLTHLFIGANSLPRLPDLSALEMLASIDVSGNSLKELNPSIWELPRLRELRAADNDIAELRVEEGEARLALHAVRDAHALRRKQHARGARRARRRWRRRAPHYAV